MNKCCENCKFGILSRYLSGMGLIQVKPLGTYCAKFDTEFTSTSKCNQYQIPHEDRIGEAPRKKTV